MAISPFLNPFGAIASGAGEGYNAGVSRVQSMRQLQAQMALKQSLADLLYKGKIDPANIRQQTSLDVAGGYIDPATGQFVPGRNVNQANQVANNNTYHMDSIAARIAANLGSGTTIGGDYQAALGMLPGQGGNPLAAGYTPQGGPPNPYNQANTVTPPPGVPAPMPPGNQNPVTPAVGTRLPVAMTSGDPAAVAPSAMNGPVSTGPPTTISGLGPLIAPAPRVRLDKTIQDTKQSQARTDYLTDQDQKLNAGAPYWTDDAYQANLLARAKAKDLPGLDSSLIKGRGATAAMDTAITKSIPGKTAAQIAADAAAALHNTVAAHELPVQVGIQQQNATTSAGRLSVARQAAARLKGGDLGPTYINSQQEAINKANATKNYYLTRRDNSGNPAPLSVAERQVVNAADQNILTAQHNIRAAQSGVNPVTGQPLPGHVAPMPVGGMTKVRIPAGGTASVRSAPPLPRTFNYRGKPVHYTVTK